jgi:hypothetical protein
MTNDELLAALQSSTKSEATKATNQSRVASLLKLRHSHSDDSLYKILMNPVKYSARIQEQYPSVTTQKNLVTTILAIIKHSGLPRSAEWTEIRKKLHGVQLAQQKIELDISYKEIKKKYKEIKRSPDPHANLRDSLMLTFLSFIVYHAPKRAELGAVHLGCDDDAKNCIVLVGDNDSYARIKGKKEMLHPKFVRVLKKSIKRHPRQYLFIQQDGSPFLKNNSYTQFIIRNMERLFDGRRLGCGMLRHIYETSRTSSS